MQLSLSDATVEAAIAHLAADSASKVEKLEMLLEIAADLQTQPKTPKPLYDAIALYQRALDWCGEEYPLWQGRALAGKGIALRSLPDAGLQGLLESKAALLAALPKLQAHATPEEVAEAEMNLGLVLQALVPLNAAQLSEAVQAYQRALRVFSGPTHPQAYAIVQNNIAIAYLSLPLAPEQAGMRQALAVQAWEEALQWVNRNEHPNEYAMLHNNLANTLQYLPSTHPVENNQRAIAAYDQALQVRTRQDMPREYASTIANKANALYNLPDDPEHPERGNAGNLRQAQTYYQQAQEIFNQLGEGERAAVVAQALAAVEQELQALATMHSPQGDHDKPIH